MKYRQGFVSNSSTTSFCIYGVYLTEDTVRKEITDTLDDDYNIMESLAEENKLEYHSFDDTSIAYIGLSWSSIGDNETGKEFKQRVENIVKKFTDQKCVTHEEGWYDG